MLKFLLTLALLFPGISLAQTGTTSLQNLLTNLAGFINNLLIPAVLAIAFLLFVINVFRYFVVQSTTEEGQKKARALALWSVLAFVAILLFWSLTGLIVSGIGLTDKCVDGYNRTFSDYVARTPLCSSPPPKPKPTPPPTTPPTKPPTPPTPPAPGGGLGDGGTPTPPAAAATIAAVRAKTKTYFDSTMGTTFGHNRNAVASGLLADLYTTTSSHVSNQDRSVAAYRLQQLGVLTDKDFTDYLAALNAEEVAKGSIVRFTPISAKAAAVTSPNAALNANTNQTFSAMADIGIGKEDMAVLIALRDSPQKTAEKIKTFDFFYNSGTKIDGFWVPADHDPGGKVRKDYVADTNAAAFFAGSTAFIK